MTKDEVQYVHQSLQTFSIKPQIISKFCDYIDIINVYKNKIRLVGDYNVTSIVDNLIAPSLLSLKFISQTRKQLIYDIGSGSGIASISIKLVSNNVELKLIERNLKKIAFINDVINKLDIKDVTIFPKSIENIENNCLQDVDYLLIRGIKLVNIYKILMDKFPRGTSIIHFASLDDMADLPITLNDSLPFPGNDQRQKKLFVLSLTL